MNRLGRFDNSVAHVQGANYFSCDLSEYSAALSGFFLLHYFESKLMHYLECLFEIKVFLSMLLREYLLLRCLDLCIHTNC